jgi:hypothetical protein
MVDFDVVVDGGRKWWQFWRRAERFQFSGEMRIRVWQRAGGSRNLNAEPLEIQGMTMVDGATSLVVSFDGKSRLKRMLGRPPLHLNAPSPGTSGRGGR